MTDGPEKTRDTFLKHRFITDAIGHLAASYASLGATYVIDSVSHTPSNFNHVFALCLTAAYIIMDYLIAKWLGNIRWFGLISLVTASLSGYILFMLGLQLGYAIYSAFDTPGFYFAFVMSPIFLIPALISPLLVRLMAFPIVGVFQPSE